MTTSASDPKPVWLTSPRRWLCAALIGGLLCVAAYWLEPARSLQAHLLAVVLWTGVSIGALLLLMLHNLVGGNWGLLLRPQLVSAVQPIWLLALAFVPILLQMHLLYPWASWKESTTDAHLWAKASYLDPQMFTLRAVIYWVFWVLGAWLASHSARRGTTTRNWTGLHAMGMPLLVISVTFAAVDWWMSLEPEWFASSYGLLILAGQGAAALAMCIMLAAAAPQPVQQAPHDSPPHEGHVPISPWRDVGNLLFAAICLWMYIAYTQYLIIWSGNLPEEATWYLVRGQGAWRWVAVAVVVLHFAVPFMLLLSRSVKENPRRLALVAALIFAMHFVEGAWLVVPAFGKTSWSNLIICGLAIASIGAAWFCLFSLRFKKETQLATR